MDRKFFFDETATDGFSISLCGFTASVSKVFSFAAPEFDSGEFFSVSARLPSEWLVVCERIDHFSVSITGLISGFVRRTVRAVMTRCVKRTPNFRRLRIMRLSFCGFRL